MQLDFSKHLFLAKYIHTILSQYAAGFTQNYIANKKCIDIDLKHMREINEKDADKNG